ncbi:MAG: hypothetical protein HY537_11280 [Deltaproteobacteria bacterium]|nr:hypothetical protein [Deltaproteobacteria bacterium]
MGLAQFFMLLAFCVFSWPLQAAKLKRVVLSPWSSVESKEIYRSTVLRHVESVLNYLGLYVEYFDIDKDPLPDP